MIYESELYHHGILGQKWGKKNGPPYPLKSSSGSSGSKSEGSSSEGSSNENDSNKNSSPTSKERKNAKKAVQRLSDAELANSITRLQMENTYLNLLSNQSINEGKEFAKSVIKKSTDNIATQTLAYIEGVGVNNFYKRLFNTDENIVNPKKGQKDKK